MRPQEHAQLSAVAAAAAWPWLKQDVWIPFVASILIDADHYLWHAVTQRTLSLRAALRYYRRANIRQVPEQRLLHQTPVLALLLLLAVSTRSRLLGLILAGLIFHVGLDRFHKHQLRTLKLSLSAQTDFTCPRCGQKPDKLEMHTIYKSNLILTRYQPRNFIVLCPTCHRVVDEEQRQILAMQSRALLS